MTTLNSHSPSKKKLSTGETGEFQPGPVAPYEPENTPDSPDSPVTARERVQGVLDWGSHLPDRLIQAVGNRFSNPPTWREMTDYARNNARLVNAPALVKGIAAFWFWFIAAPTFALARIREFVFGRFLRGLITLTVVELFLRFTPMGRWAASVTRGFYHLLAILLLP